MQDVKELLAHPCTSTSYSSNRPVLATCNGTHTHRPKKSLIIVLCWPAPGQHNHMSERRARWSWACTPG